ncbi:Virulence protein RhuM family protein [Chitinophaga eiseniae]|uniref:Virulence protein RhuM family protein n=1 Tax=Chitinophaga eiseniae TaxID=634771 RepID=A0A1T4L4K5_9BACT|nr:Fic family protein [Chitinophaga eiseniae]SJZ49655.1 Virulence protein RhuM family protein [Chitinophaga eiseniae]
MFNIVTQNSSLRHPITDHQVAITATLHEGVIWLDIPQIAALLELTEEEIRLHIEKLYLEGEAEEASTNNGTDSYALEIAIAIAYRISSKRCIQFRSWVSKTLNAQLLPAAPAMPTDETAALQQVLTDYAYALDILDQYDHQRLQITGTTADNLFHITYPAAMAAIHGLKDKFGGSSLFGNEKDDSFRSSLAVIYQTFDGITLYPGVEEKAAHLLYFVVKNHSFSDGNKRIAAFLFVWFMGKNNLLYRKDGSKRIADNALVAMTLMIAESKADEMDMMIKVVVNLINAAN